MPPEANAAMILFSCSPFAKVPVLALPGPCDKIHMKLPQRWLLHIVLCVASASMLCWRLTEAAPDGLGEGCIMAAVSIKGVLIADSACLKQIVRHLALAYTRQISWMACAHRGPAATPEDTCSVSPPLLPGGGPCNTAALVHSHRTCQTGIVERNRVPAVTPVDINLLILDKVLYPVQVSHPRSMVDVCFGTCSAHLQPFRHVRYVPLRKSETLQGPCMDNTAHVVYEIRSVGVD